MKTGTGLIIIGVVIVIAIIVGAYYLTMGVSSIKSPYTTTASSSVAYTTTAYSTVPASNTSTQATTTANQTNTANASYTVNIAQNSKIGSYLTNSSGFTLYYNKNDAAYANTSVCYGGCSTVWPAFYTANLAANPSLTASGFGTMTRTDGTKQITYMGHPLYTYAGDNAAGQINGQGIEGIWFAYNMT